MNLQESQLHLLSILIDNSFRVMRIDEESDLMSGNNEGNYSWWIVNDFNCANTSVSGSPEDSQPYHEIKGYEITDIFIKNWVDKSVILDTVFRRVESEQMRIMNFSALYKWKLYSGLLKNSRGISV